MAKTFFDNILEKKCNVDIETIFLFKLLLFMHLIVILTSQFML